MYLTWILDVFIPVKGAPCIVNEGIIFSHCAAEIGSYVYFKGKIGWWPNQALMPQVPHEKLESY